MRVLINFIKNCIFLFIAILAFNSCVLDEFKVDELKMKEDTNRKTVAPLFHGTFEFKDLIYNDEGWISQPGEQISTLKFPNNDLLNIPSRIIFEPTIIIKNFSIWLNGNFNFSKVDFIYTVSNGAPFPLNFQMQFFETSTTLNTNPVILPPPFMAANSSGAIFVPVESEHTIPLDEEQLLSFLNGEMVQFQTWFDRSELINLQDTFLSNYPITISVVLQAEIDANN